jgi:hypothetical protein
MDPCVGTLFVYTWQSMQVRSMVRAYRVCWALLKVAPFQLHLARPEGTCVIRLRRVLIFTMFIYRFYHVFFFFVVTFNFISL